MYKLKTLYNKLVAKGHRIDFIIDATDEQYPEFDHADEYLDTHGDLLVRAHCLGKNNAFSLIVQFKKEDK